MKLLEHLVLDGYLDRITLIETRWFSLMFHRFLGSDPDLCLHDHPWWYLSWLVRGSYTEETPAGSFSRRLGDVVFRKATHVHRVVVAPGKPVWTLVLTGPESREWGFHTKRRGVVPGWLFLKAGRPASWCS